MKQCPECHTTPSLLLGKNYCTDCGVLLVDVPVEYKHCANSACRMSESTLHIPLTVKYCGECGELLETREG